MTYPFKFKELKMTKQVDHYVSTTVLLDHDAYPASLKRLYVEALRNKSITYAVENVVAARQALLDEAGFTSELQHAVLAAANDGDRFHLAVLETLHERELDFLALREDAREAQRAWKAKCEARYEEIRPTLTGVMRELLDLDPQAKAIEARISGFARAQADTRERYQTAGLSEAEIDAIGVKPGEADLAEWRRELARIREREAQLDSFIKSGPWYDESILGTEASA
ncbi:hypothetical protein [Cupriavidus oxalaticus]|uniref:hypothetical protein n=1 Tax=Cupriavidus oxalaticus TaxID=96344 RepID=UPI0031745A84